MSRRRIDRRGATLLVVCASLFVQLLAPYAVAASLGVDVARLICAPSGGGALAEAEALFADLLDQESEERGALGDCPACMLAYGAPLPEIQTAAQPAPFAAIIDTPVFETAFAYPAQGPPLGLRAPPATTL